MLPSPECMPLNTVEAVAGSDTALSHHSALSASVQESYGSLLGFFFLTFSSGYFSLLNEFSAAAGSCFS